MTAVLGYYDLKLIHPSVFRHLFTLTNIAIIQLIPCIMLSTVFTMMS